ncbi:uncharacterized protein LOC135122114 [Zophobas morio]|uniref:uncharacterized protein LOC135122114 n=1 Tax=Zophobas morio TaxID=2755281 RepID=UPI0030833FEF
MSGGIKIKPKDFSQSKIESQPFSGETKLKSGIKMDNLFAVNKQPAFDIGQNSAKQKSLQNYNTAYKEMPSTVSKERKYGFDMIRAYQLLKQKNKLKKNAEQTEKKKTTGYCIPNLVRKAEKDVPKQIPIQSHKLEEKAILDNSEIVTESRLNIFKQEVLFSDHGNTRQFFYNKFRDDYNLKSKMGQLEFNDQKDNLSVNFQLLNTSYTSTAYEKIEIDPAFLYETIKNKLWRDRINIGDVKNPRDWRYSIENFVKALAKYTDPDLNHMEYLQRIKIINNVQAAYTALPEFSKHNAVIAPAQVNRYLDAVENSLKRYKEII